MPITKTTVTHSLIDPSASPVQRGGTITLGGFVGREWRNVEGMTTDGQIITWEPANADGTGSWSVDLIPNAAITPENTLYRYQPAQGTAVVFQVGDVSPSKLSALLVTDPAQWPGLTPTTVGPAGPANTLTPGTATTGAPGTAMSFDITGDAPNQTLNVTIPRGDPGEAATVDVDPNPITGAPGTDVAVENTGDSHAAVLKFTVPRGDAGPAATVEVDSTTTGAPGTSAAVQNVGTTSAAKLKFTVPRGDIGPGATVAVGTTTTGAPGTNATVGNAGTPTASVLNFVIPRGDSGNPGPGLNFQGNVATSTSLPATGDIGDAWLADDTSHVWAWGDAAATPNNPFELRGTGFPEGVVTASPGTYYTDSAGTNGAWRWLKTSGTGNTGWVVTVGDTGWRDVTADVRAFTSLNLGTGFNQYLLMRTNNLCTFQGMFKGATNTSYNGALYGIPVGFNDRGPGQGEGHGFALYRANRTAVGGIMFDGTSTLFINTPGDTAGIYITWACRTAWPSVLPGTPA